MKKIYISYSQKDKAYYEQMIQHLIPLETFQGIKIFKDSLILPGEDWNDSIRNFIEESDIILILLSADYLASDYCYHELNMALHQVQEKGKIIVPVILRPCAWQEILGKYFALPNNAVPILSDKWLTVDDAFNNVSTELQKLIYVDKFSQDKIQSKGVKKIYLSYSLKDSQYRIRLLNHLKPFEARGIVSIWDDRKLLPGDEWDMEILKNIADSDAYISLVTPDYLSSAYISQRELEAILNQVSQFSKPLLPLLVKPCNWRSTPLEAFQQLPRDGSFIANTDEDSIEREFLVASIEIVLSVLKDSNELIKNELSIEIKRLEEIKFRKEHEVAKPDNKPLHNSPMKRVFISYNHKDADVANKLKSDLEKHDIEVVIDQKMQIGADIQRFIEESVYNTDYTISVVSINSMFSSWVAMESINTLFKEKGTGKNKFIGCYIDKNFFNRDFPDQVIDFLDSELKAISELIPKRLDRNAGIEDLQSEFKRIRDFKHDIDSIINKLRNSKCLDISATFYEKNIEALIESINQE